MAVRMELSRILIRELNSYQIIELREVVEGSGSLAADAAEPAQEGLEAEGPGAAGMGEHEPGMGSAEAARTFPIVIGLPEAQAIERRLKGETVKRPQTHDLLASVIGHLGGRLRSITISDLSEHTFFATLDIMRGDGELVHIDARPSDAIALGVASDVPILVEEHVLEAATREEM